MLPTVAEIRALLWNDQQEKAKILFKRLAIEKPEDPEVAELGKIIGAWTEHLDSVESYAAFYQSHRGPEAYVAADAIASHHLAIHRLGKVREWMEKRQPKRILDLGCFDGYALLNLCHGFGAIGVGVDLDKAALTHAAASAATLGIQALFLPYAIEELALGETFDTILLMETLEHVRDPRLVLEVAERHLEPGGRIYIDVPATPVPHDGNEHEAREHLRVFDESTLLQLIGDRAVQYHITIDLGRHQERVLCYAKPRTAFVVNPITGGWNPLDSKTWGGSEEMVMGLASAAANAGHEVEVFYNPSPETAIPEPHVGNFDCKPHEKWVPSDPHDLVVLVKWPEGMDKPINARRVFFWTADPNTSNDLTPERLEKLGSVIAISNWHRHELIGNGLPENKVITFPLGVSAAVNANLVPIDRNPHHVVYASSFDRGLERLLDDWPEVVAAVPDATLHIYYGWDIFDKVTAGNPAAVEFKERLNAKMLSTLNVIVHQRTVGDDLTPYITSGLWAYPATGGERFCLTGIKAQRLGAVPVITPVMALHETVKYGYKVESHDFIPALIHALEHPEEVAEIRVRMMADPEVALAWDEIYCRHWRQLWMPALHIPWQPMIRAKFPLKRQSLSICMITLNSEPMLIRTLRSIQSLADIIYFADQGSTDRTLEIGKQFGVKVIECQPPYYCIQCQRVCSSVHFEDGNHEPFGFEGPRNVSISAADTDWIGWIDTDEELIRPDNFEKYLRRNMFNGYAIRQWHFSIQPPNAFKPDLPVRVFRNGLGIQFIGKIHEHPEIRVNEGVTPATVVSDVDIAHDGYFVEEGRRKKFMRNIGLMKADRKKYPHRMLGKFLWLRDLMHLSRYDLEATGGRLTPGVVTRCQEAISLYEEEFLGKANLYAEEGLDYYSEALRILNIGFDVTWSASAAPHNAQPSEPRRARFSSIEAWQKHLTAQTQSVVLPFSGKYV